MNYEILTNEEIVRALSNVPAAVRGILQREDVVLAGGAVRDTMAALPAKDVDIFCHSREQAEKLAKQLAGFDPSAPEVRETMFAFSVDFYGVPVQFVFYKDFSDARDLISQFDFRACCVGIYWDGCWCGVAVEGFREDCAARVLRFMSQAKDEHKLTALRRALTFAGKGWTISNAELARILLHWQDVKMTKATYDAYEAEHAKVVHAFRPGYGGRR